MSFDLIVIVAAPLIVLACGIATVRMEQQTAAKRERALDIYGAYMMQVGRDSAEPRCSCSTGAVNPYCDIHGSNP